MLTALTPALIRSTRDAAGLTQSEFGLLLGISVRMIADYEHSDHGPRRLAAAHRSTRIILALVCQRPDILADLRAI